MFKLPFLENRYDPAMIFSKSFSIIKKQAIIALQLTYRATAWVKRGNITTDRIAYQVELLYLRREKICPTKPPRSEASSFPQGPSPRLLFTLLAALMAW